MAITIDNRTIGKRGCPFCAGHKICIHDSLYMTYPEVASEWDYQNNNGMNPSEVSPKSKNRYRWICKIILIIAG